MIALSGTILKIYITPSAGEPMREVREVMARAGRGLDGDRYAAGIGTWSDRLAKGPRDLTLIPEEGLTEMAREGIPLDPADSRRNILTRGIDVASLVGKQFRIGEAVCYGIRRCQPCSYLEERTRPGVLKAMVDRGGLFAQIVQDGRIAVGDRVVELRPEG